MDGFSGGQRILGYTASLVLLMKPASLHLSHIRNGYVVLECQETGGLGEVSYE